MTWHGAFSSASIIRVTASAAVTRTAGVVEQRLAEPSSGGSLRGYSAHTTKTMPWPPGSRITSKAASRRVRYPVVTEDALIRRVRRGPPHVSALAIDPSPPQ